MQDVEAWESQWTIRLTKKTGTAFAMILKIYFVCSGRKNINRKHKDKKKVISYYELRLKYSSVNCMKWKGNDLKLIRKEIFMNDFHTDRTWNFLFN